MMKNLVIGLMLVGTLAACKKEKPQDVVLNAQPATTQQAPNGMPKLTMSLTDGSNVTMSDLNGKVLLVCYNPGCDHCQREAKVLSENKDLFKDYQVYFLTPESMEEAAKFQKEYKLEDSNVHFGRAEVSPIIETLGAITTVPTFFVYKDQALVKRLQGEVKLEELRTAMQ